MDTVGGILMIAGAVFMLLAGVGVVRFHELYARMHAASKGPTLGLLLVATGAGLALGTTAVVIELVLVVVLQMLTAPVGSHLVGRSVHRRVSLHLDAVDELARDEALAAERAADAAADRGAEPDRARRPGADGTT